MNKFRIGDHVRVIDRTSNKFDQVGTIAETHYSADLPFLVDGLGKFPLLFRPEELILADPHHEMINDPEGQALVQAIHDRKEHP